jgi:hypothetical protein
MLLRRRPARPSGEQGRGPTVRCLIYHKLGGPAYADLPPSKQRVFVGSKPELCGARAVRGATAFDESATCARAARSHCLLATLLRARPASVIASRRRDPRPHERKLDASIRSGVDHFARPRLAERPASTSTLPTTRARPSHSALRRRRDPLTDLFASAPASSTRRLARADPRLKSRCEKLNRSSDVSRKRAASGRDDADRNDQTPRQSRIRITEQASAAKTRPTFGRAGPRAHRPVSDLSQARWARVRRPSTEQAAGLCPQQARVMRCARSARGDRLRRERGVPARSALTLLARDALARSPRERDRFTQSRPAAPRAQARRQHPLGSRPLRQAAAR